MEDQIQANVLPTRSFRPRLPNCSNCLAPEISVLDFEDRTSSMRHCIKDVVRGNAECHGSGMFRIFGSVGHSQASPTSELWQMATRMRPFSSRMALHLGTALSGVWGF